MEIASKLNRSPSSGAAQARWWIIGGGMISAFFASLCCLGPLLAGAFGLGAFAAAGFLHPFRPLFLGVALVLVASAWIWDWQRRRRLSAAGGDEAACECRRRTGSRMVLAALTAVILALGFSTYALERVAARSIPTGEAAPARAKPGGLAKWEVPISGMYCPSCTIGLERAFMKLDGVESAAVDYVRGEPWSAMISVRSHPKI